MNKNILILVGLVVVALFGWWFLSTQPAAQPAAAPANETPSVESTGTLHEVVLTEAGFVPKEITIALGDTVVFSSTAERPFWPASSVHPSHRDYPGGIFDPKKPIQPDAMWSFTFDLSGDWKYHNHLAPNITGVVHVIE